MLIEIPGVCMAVTQTMVETPRYNVWICARMQDMAQAGDVDAKYLD